MHINQLFSCLICSVILSTAAQLSQSAYFALQCPYTVFGLGRTPNFVDDLAVGMPGSIKRVRIGKHLHRVFADRVRQNASLSWCSCGTNPKIFEVSRVAPTDFIRDISAGKLNSFRLDYVSVRDERGPVINHKLW